MKRSRLTYLLTGALISLGACDQEKNEPMPTPKTSLLTGKDWLLTTSTIAPAFQGSTDQKARLQACFLDNIMRYEPKGVYRVYQGATKCSSQDKASYEGTWTFNADETELTTDLPGIHTTYNLVDLTESEFTVSYSFPSANTVYTVTTTYTKQ
jgi:hypothetical protein